MAMDMYDNSDIDLAIARVQLAIAESDIRGMKKSRTNYASRSKQNKTYKPNGVVASNFTYAGPNDRKASNFTYDAPKAPKKTTTKTTSKKDTSFKKSGVSGVLKSVEANKFKDTFKKKGLIPALRGK